MANEKNLRPQPWKPGQSGNPAGKPKGCRSMKTILRELLDVELDTKGENPLTKEKITGKLTAQEIVAMKLIREATKGNMYAIREIFDRMDGQAEQQITVTGSASREDVLNELDELKGHLDRKNPDSRKRIK